MTTNHEFKSDKVKKKDEYYTKVYAILPIMKYLEEGKTIWCPFDTEDSLFVKIFRKEGFNVIATHIFNGKDFFKIEIPECDYIISNPPYSKRNEILKKLFELKKPFAMLMNTNGLFDSNLRWNLFKNNKFTLIYLKGRVNYSEDNIRICKSSPPFQSAYICYKISDKQIILEEWR